ncbi:hypothetical protein CONLIGDRAFT_635071 [Coniochaeta ligniaria NRRL 30616]|uniref:Uncharacterized protein n=1 Tax=Coniochaeta ligniaria NRRL 30616 TaxID=1408157 RepID=A0A1J7IHS2_9PEZI|nr:hypothetical protein CONLIGDRAFT_635071 [Coniochaeta ligniaria NRRL 30616]
MMRHQPYGQKSMPLPATQDGRAQASTAALKPHLLSVSPQPHTWVAGCIASLGYACSGRASLLKL